MKERWEPMQKQKEKFIPMIKEFVKKAEENPDTTEFIDFYNQGISPYQLKTILIDELGFEEIYFDFNGCNFDFWIELSKNGRNYIIAGTGITFEMVFRLE